MNAERTKPNVVVLGSINMDLVAACRDLPRPGQTLTATSFAEIPGGKGANQAVAASRAGGQVRMIGRVGNDGFASRLLRNLAESGVDCAGIQSTESPSGLAMIAVAESGENQIIVVPGANGQLSCHDVERHSAMIEQSDVLLLQLEVPLESVSRAIEIARRADVRVILDPAPATAELPDELFPVIREFGVDLICPNETEAAMLANTHCDSEDSLQAAAGAIYEQGAEAVAITLGARGTLLFDGRDFSRVDAYRVMAVDTTAAGDAFAGTLAVRWAETNSLPDSILWGNAAGALAASRPGAQPGMAARDEIERKVEQLPG